jgi:hypothetical protein
MNNQTAPFVEFQNGDLIHGSTSLFTVHLAFSNTAIIHTTNYIRPLKISNYNYEDILYRFLCNLRYDLGFLSNLH